MKRFLIAMTVFLAIVSCGKNEVQEIPDEIFDDLVFTASFEGANSRVSVSEDGDGYKLAWSADDDLAVYTRKTKTKYIYNSTDDVFKRASNNVGPSLNTNYYAVHPYTAAAQSISEDGEVAVDMLLKQNYAVNSFGLNANVMVSSCPKPESASDTPIELSFKNLGGYLRLFLYGEDVVVKSIELRGNNDEILSGSANVKIEQDAAPEITWVSTSAQPIILNCGDGVEIGTSVADATAFWFVVPPTSFEKGFKVKITDVDGRVMQKSLDSAFEIARNTVETMEPLAVEFPEVDTSLLLDVKFNEDGTASDNGKYFMEVTAYPGAGMSIVTDEDYPYGKVAKFTNCDGLKNADLTNSFFMIDYSNSPDFKNSLVDDDGFTLEYVAKHGIYSRSGDHPWQNPVSSNTFGIFQKGTDTSGNAGWLTARHVNDSNNNNPFNAADNLRFSTYLNKYHHYTYVYDKANSKVVCYCNGEFINEITNVTVAEGKYLAIGGFPKSNSLITHAFTGSVAMVRIYASAVTANQVKDNFKKLNLPSAYEPVGEPLFDAQFNADGTAENIGTADLSIETIANSNVLTTVQKGDKYVANFYRASKNNSKILDGFYLTDYSKNSDFLNSLKDGYTMEVICKVKQYEGDYWSKVFSTSTAGIHHQGAYSVESEAWCWGIYGNAEPDQWNTGNGFGSFRSNFFWGPKVSFTSYEHVLLVFDGASNVFAMYVNGEHIHSYASPKMEANVGTMLAIGGMQYSVKSVYHPFVGEVAVARVYDQVMSINQAAERFAEEQPTIDALNAAQ